MKRALVALFGALAFPMIGLRPRPAAAQAIPTPTSHFGFELGTDGRLAHWDALVAYYQRLAEASDRVEVEDLGKTVRGNPFLLVTISAPANLERKDRLAEISRRLADPRGLADADVNTLAAEGRAVVAVTVGLHSTEVAAMQMAPGLAYQLASADDLATREILDNVVFLLFPSFNPDGHQMVARWVDSTRGTPFAGSRLPDMYHHYVGHDNNRDAYMLTQNEAQYFARVVYHEWIPQWYLDVHQMGSYGPRLYVPPYDDPINPNVDPLIWAEHDLVGANMLMVLEREGVTGVATGTYYTGWWFPSFHMATNHHNIAGMLTESASANMAEPLLIHEQQLQPHGRKHRIYGRMQVFPHPWNGGWWRLSNIIRQQQLSTYAMLAAAARYRETVLRDMVFKARRSIERGRTEPPFGFIIPVEQHDPLTVDKLIGILVRNNVEVHRATSDFVHEGRTHRAGDYVVSTAQPNGVLVRSVLSRTFYPDDASTRRDDGEIVPPYDMANFVLTEQMGVRAIPIESPLSISLEALAAAPKRAGRLLGSGSAGWLIAHEVNDGFRVTNAVLAEGGSVFWLRQPLERDGVSAGPGAVWIPSRGIGPARARQLAEETGVDFTALPSPPAGPAYRLKPLRLGLYRRFLGEQLDEGWTRFLFDTWGFPYRRLEADDIRRGALESEDVLLIPADDLEHLKGEGDVAPPGEGDIDEYPETFLPPRYTEGLDQAAIDRIKAFVRGGGTLILLDDAAELAMEEMGVPVENVVADLPREQFFSPGSNLRARFDRSHPLAYGMPASGYILNWGSPVFAIDRTAFNARIAAPVRYVDRDLLQSGWLVGEEKIAGMPAALDIEYGSGRILMIGFRSQHRAQTHGTFKIFFNALYYGPAQKVDLSEVPANGG